MNNLLTNATENLSSVLQFLAPVIALLLAAILLEKADQKEKGINEEIFNTRKITMIAMFAAIATILMMFEIPLPFAPIFYKLDFGQLPILIGTFAFGPAAGVMMEIVKILLKLFIKGTTTAFVGELANFVVECSFILPASVIYTFRKNKKGAILACISGTVIMAIFGSMFNAVYLIPAFSKLYGISIDRIVEMGMAINPLVSEGSLTSFVIACVVPLNLLKGALVSIITMCIYKPLSPIIKYRYKL